MRKYASDNDIGTDDGLNNLSNRPVYIHLNTTTFAKHQSLLVTQRFVTESNYQSTVDKQNLNRPIQSAVRRDEWKILTSCV